VNYPALKDGVFPLMPPRTPQDKFEPEHTKKVLDLLETLWVSRRREGSPALHPHWEAHVDCCLWSPRCRFYPEDHRVVRPYEIAHVAPAMPLDEAIKAIW